MSATAALVAGAGVGAAAAAAVAARRVLDPPFAGIPVLRYTLVGPPRPGSRLNELRVPPSQLGEQLRHLARRRFRAVGLEEALAQRRRRAFHRRRPVVITFDGPYAGFLEAAFPALRRYRLLPVTLFFPAERLGASTVRFRGGRSEPVLRAADLRRLARQGVHVGLQVRAREGEAEAERRARWTAERERLAEAVGRDVTLVAPVGDAAGPGMARTARAAGFRAAVLPAGGGLLPRRGSPYAVPRYVLRPGAELVHLALFLSRRRAL